MASWDQLHRCLSIFLGPNGLESLAELSDANLVTEYSMNKSIIVMSISRMHTRNEKFNVVVKKIEDRCEFCVISYFVPCSLVDVLTSKYIAFPQMFTLGARTKDLHVQACYQYSISSTFVKRTCSIHIPISS
jgi:hypothetical protein